MCTVTPSDPSTQRIAWLIDEFPYTIMLLHNRILNGYSATLGSSYLIVEDIKKNDARNGKEFLCVVVLRNDTTTILDRSDPTTLYIVGE